MYKSIIAFIVGFVIGVGHVFAAVKAENVDYYAKNTEMEGFVAFEAEKGKRPAVLIIPDWMGVSDFAKGKAHILAKDGYVAFVADVYGKGIRPTDNKQAGELAAKYKADRPLLREHVKAAYDKLVEMPQVDPNRIVVMGYCFGGTTALELARSGAPLVGTASFHGGLSTPTPDDAKNIQGPVLIMHGANDPSVPPAEVRAFQEEMTKAGVNVRFISYPGAVHSFTNPAAGNDPSKGVAYNKDADFKSWAEFQQFLKDVFK